MSSSFAEVLEEFLERIYNKTYPMAIWIFMKTCRLYNMIKDGANEVYKSNETIRNSVDEVAYQYQSVYSFVTNQKIEPRETIWLSNCWITPNMSSLTKYYNYVENNGHFFTRFFSNDLFDEGFSHYAIKYLEAICNRNESKSESYKIDPLIVIKTLSPDDRIFYIVRRAIIPLAPFLNKRSINKLISVEYSHPDMNDTIELVMNDEWFIQGNELFTPTFVLRMLEYQSKSFLYDNQYKIRIMDSECNILEFGADRYMLITADGYEWIPYKVITPIFDDEEGSETDYEDN